MTITYHAGRRIQGTNSERTGLNSGSTTASPDATNMEDSGSWSGDGSLSVANGQIQVRLGGSNAGRAKRDYGTANIDTSKWVMRFKWVQNGTQTLSSPNDMRCIIGLSSSDGSFGGNAPTYGTTTQDMVGMYLDVGHVHLVGIDNTASPSGQPTADSLLNFDTAGGGSGFTRYVEIKRNGDSFTLNIFTSSSFTGTPISSTKTISNIGSLRYVGASAGWYGGGGGINADISEIAFYNGVSSVTTLLPPNLQDGTRFEETDTRKIYYGALPSVTYEDDFSGTDDWTDSDSTIVGVNTTTDVLDFKEKDGNFEEVSFYDITALGTDPSFVFRCKYHVGTKVQSGNTDSVRITLGLSTGGDIGEGVARDEVAVVWRVTNTINKWYAFVADGVGNNYSGTDFTTAIPSTTGGDGSGNYWFEIIGNGGTYTFNIYSDEYSSLIESEEITDAGLTGLNKIVVRSLTLTTTNNQARGYIDDVKFYDGVTSIDFTWTEES